VKIREDARHYVYRIWDHDGSLAWVGATSNLVARIDDYRRNSAEGAPLWAAVEYPTRAAAFAAERAAIAAELPRNNRQSKPTGAHLRTAYERNGEVSLERDYDLNEVADAIGMSTRWIRDRIREGKQGTGPVVEHIRYGHVIKFTAAQVDRLKAQHTVAPALDDQVTTGRKKRAS